MQSALWDQMVTFFLSAFRFPGLDGRLVLLAIALGLAFGAIWLLAYRPSRTNTRGLLGVAAASAFLTWTAIAFLQVPLQIWCNEALLSLWGESTVLHWVLLAGIPIVLVSGLVQEGAKLVPVVAYRMRRRGTFDARTGLLVGAIAGAGFGVFEAVWVHNATFAAGISWQALQVDPFAALSPFAERFFAVGFHVAISALAGYGLATGRGRQFCLLAAGLHGVGNYVEVLGQAGVLGGPGALLYVTVFTLIVAAAVLRLRWKETTVQTEGGAAAAIGRPVQAR